jgi:hypothetical protein
MAFDEETELVNESMLLMSASAEAAEAEDEDEDADGTEETVRRDVCNAAHVKDSAAEEDRPEAEEHGGAGMCIRA